MKFEKLFFNDLEQIVIKKKMASVMKKELNQHWLDKSIKDF